MEIIPIVTRRGDGIIRHFRPAAIRAARRKYPDSIMQDTTTPWPTLEGVLGVFFTSRSGSTALSRFAEQHFKVSDVSESLNGPQLHARMERRLLDNYPAALKYHINHHSPAGWYMFKSGNPGLLSAARMGFLDEYGSVLHPIFLLRQDIVGQALSLFSASRTKRFHSTQTAAHELREEDYDYRSIAKYLATILKGNLTIDTIMREAGFVMQPLLYEEFKDGDYDIALRILTKTGLPRRKNVRIRPSRAVKRITHPLTNHFRERFMAELSPRTRKLISDHEHFVEKRLNERRLD